VAVIRQVGEQQQWDLEPLQDPNVDLNACECAEGLLGMCLGCHSYQGHS
jgi:hypothetical protein